MSDEPLEQAWAQVVDDWTADEAHWRFIGLCDVLGRLDEAGARYRAIRDEDPERAEEAARRIDQVVARALVSLHAHETEAPKRNRTGLLLLATFVFLAILGTTMWMIGRVGSW